MGDRFETLKGEVRIVFKDNTKVRVSEYSKLVIDTFIYDSKAKKGKLNLKARLGNLRYTSGLIAKNSRENVKISTPTASVSVRGTDFEVIVKESGKSIFTLLPSITNTGTIYTGAIDVSTAVGQVSLTTAYQVTQVITPVAPPTPPRVDTARRAAAKIIKKKDSNDKEEPEDKEDAEKGSSEQTSIKESIDDDSKEEVMVKQDESSANIFEIVDGKAIFVREDGGNYTKIILNEATNASLNYENKTSTVGGNLNNGGSVNINIIQQ